MKLTIQQTAKLKSLLEAIIDNDPNETISDAGHTVWDLCRHDSEELLAHINEYCAHGAAISVQEVTQS